MPTKKYYLRRIFGYLKPNLHLFGISVILSLLTVVFESISLWIVATLADTLFHPSQATGALPAISFGDINTFLKQLARSMVVAATPMGTLTRVCAVFLASFFLKNAFGYLNNRVIAALNLLTLCKVRDDLYSHALMLPVTYYDRNRSGSILSTILNDVNRLNFAMTNAVNKSFAEPIRLVTFVVLLFIISGKLTLIVFLIYPALIYLIYQIGRTVRRRSRRVSQNMAGLTAVLHETVSCIRAVKMFNMNETEAAKFRDENRRMTRSSYRSSAISALTSPLTETLGIAVAVSLLWIGGRQVLAGQGMSAEDFLRYLTILMFSYQPLKALGSINNAMQQGMASAERVFSLLDTPQEPLAPAALRRSPSFERAIEFCNVCFTYPGSSEEVLHNISFTVPKGSITALVGSSGSGKSTILDLIPRFYPVTSGAIYIDGIDIGSCDLAGLRELFGIVSQETILFNDTVHHNIAYGRPGASREQIVEAARSANALEFIEKLPQGFDTLIGERGVMLSGGQCQRLAIARALLRNPPILILDEATSSLDTESERLVQNAINTLMASRTVLVVAHRLSTIQHADRILVLDNGNIVESGAHEELLAHGKKYRYFYQLQFRGFPNMPA